MCSRLLTRYGISNTPKMSASEDITVDGSTKSIVPSLSFCSSSLSPPSWLEPYVTTLYLPPSLALARRANSSAAAPISEPGSPTWPSLSSVWARAGVAAVASAAAHNNSVIDTYFFMIPPVVYIVNRYVGNFTISRSGSCAAHPMSRVYARAAVITRRRVSQPVFCREPLRRQSDNPSPPRRRPSGAARRQVRDPFRRPRAFP